MTAASTDPLSAAAAAAPVIHVLVIGAGAVGALYGWRLAEAHTNQTPRVGVSVVCRSTYEAVKASGYDMVSAAYGSGTYRPFSTSRSVAAATEAAAASESWNGWDFILVTTKVLPSVYNVHELIEPAVTATLEHRRKRRRAGSIELIQAPAIVLIQNGVGVEASTSTAFPYAPVFSGVTFVGVSVTPPNSVHHTGLDRVFLSVYPPTLPSQVALPPPVDVSPWSPADAEARLTLFVDLLRAGKVNAHVKSSAELYVTRLHKLIWSATVPVVCVLARCGDCITCLSHPELRATLLAVLHEMYQICAAELAKPPPPLRAATDALDAHAETTPTPLLEWQKSVFPPEYSPSNAEEYLAHTQKVGKHSPSLVLDIKYGRMPEIDVTIKQALVLAKKHGVLVPRLDTMYQLLVVVAEKAAAK